MGGEGVSRWGGRKWAGRAEVDGDSGCVARAGTSTGSQSTIHPEWRCVSCCAVVLWTRKQPAQLSVRGSVHQHAILITKNILIPDIAELFDALPKDAYMAARINTCQRSCFQADRGAAGRAV